MIKESDFLLTNQEILGGLKAAVERGETLKDAMMTFYQAGYDKLEIEEAAKAFLMEKNPAANVQGEAKKENSQKQNEKKDKTEKVKIPVPKKNLQTKPLKTISSGPVSGNSKKITKQKVSEYAPMKKERPKTKVGLVIILILILLFLSGALAVIIHYHIEVINFFNSLFA